MFNNYLTSLRVVINDIRVIKALEELWNGFLLTVLIGRMPGNVDVMSTTSDCFCYNVDFLGGSLTFIYAITLFKVQLKV